MEQLTNNIKHFNNIIEFKLKLIAYILSLHNYEFL